MRSFGCRWRSGRRVEDGAVQGRPGDSKAGRYLGNWDVGGFEQRPNGLDLFGGEFGWAAALSTASPPGPLTARAILAHIERLEAIREIGLSAEAGLRVHQNRLLQIARETGSPRS